MSSNLKSVTACFTGGRPKSLFPTYPYADFRRKDYNHMVDNVFRFIEQLYIQHGIYRFISGGAQGFDQVAFQAVARLKASYPNVENIVYVPFEHQDSKWSDYGIFSKLEYRKMLSEADAVYNCRPDIDSHAPYGVIAKALQYRNECMCNDSCMVIGQFPNDTWSTTYKSGTANCLRYANKQGITLHVYDFRN